MTGSISILDVHDSIIMEGICQDNLEKANKATAGQAKIENSGPSKHQAS